MRNLLILILLCLGLSINAQIQWNQIVYAPSADYISVSDVNGHGEWVDMGTIPLSKFLNDIGAGTTWIQTTDATLPANRSINMDGNKFAFYGGEVGIGPLSPSYPLHVIDASAVLAYFANNNADHAALWIDGNTGKDARLVLFNNDATWTLEVDGDFGGSDLTIFEGGVAAFKIDQPTNDVRVYNQLGIGVEPSRIIHTYAATGDVLGLMQTGDVSAVGWDMNNSVNSWRVQTAGSGDFQIADITDSGNLGLVIEAGTQHITATAYSGSVTGTATHMAAWDASGKLIKESLPATGSTDYVSDVTLTGANVLDFTGVGSATSQNIDLDFFAEDTDLHDAVTLSGAYDYITLVGQDIVRGQIDLTTDVTGVLPISNMEDDLSLFDNTTSNFMDNFFIQGDSPGLLREVNDGDFVYFGGSGSNVSTIDDATGPSIYIAVESSNVTNTIAGNRIATFERADHVANIDIDETVTSLSFSDPNLTYTDEAGTANIVDLSSLSSTDTNLGNAALTNTTGGDNTYTLNGFDLNFVGASGTYHMNETGNTFEVQGSDATVRISGSTSYSGGAIGTAGSQDFAIRTGGSSERMYFAHSTANIGAGTNAPITGFHLRDNGGGQVIQTVQTGTVPSTAWGALSMSAVDYSINQDNGIYIGAIESDGDTRWNASMRLRSNGSGTPRMTLGMTVYDTDEVVTTDASESIVILNNGNVGINVVDPDAELEVNGSIKMVDGNESNGYVMTSDANGVGSWQAASGGGLWTDGGDDTYLTDTGDNLVAGNTAAYEYGTGLFAQMTLEGATPFLALVDNTASANLENGILFVDDGGNVDAWIGKSSNSTDLAGAEASDLIVMNITGHDLHLGSGGDVVITVDNDGDFGNRHYYDGTAPDKIMQFFAGDTDGEEHEFWFDGNIVGFDGRLGGSQQEIGFRMSNRHTSKDVAGGLFIGRKLGMSGEEVLDDEHAMLLFEAQAWDGDSYEAGGQFRFNVRNNATNTNDWTNTSRPAEFALELGSSTQASLKQVIYAHDSLIAMRTDSIFTFSGWRNDDFREVRFRKWNGAGDDADIDGLMNGSSIGGIWEGPTVYHFGIGLRGNDANDGFFIVSGDGNYTSDNTYDKLVTEFTPTGRWALNRETDTDVRALISGESDLDLAINAATGNPDIAFTLTDDTKAQIKWIDSGDYLGFYVDEDNTSDYAGLNDVSLVIRDQGSQVGFVGIGTDNPYHELEVEGTGSLLMLDSDSGTSLIQFNDTGTGSFSSFGTSSNGLVAYSDDGFQIRDATGTTTWVNVQDDGDVKIAFNASPTGTLNVGSFTTTERGNLTDTNNGDIIYNETDNEFQVYENGSWVTMVSSGGDGNGIYDGSGSLSGNTTVTTGSNDFIITDGSLNTFIGAYPSSLDAGADNNITIGTDALNELTTGDDNIAIGLNAGKGNDTGTGSIYIGNNTASEESASDNDSNVIIGHNAARYMEADGNVIIGSQAAENNGDTGKIIRDNVYLGTRAGQVNDGDSNVFIGHDAGLSETDVDNKLIIDNEDTATPLIEGDFDQDTLFINGELGVLDAGFVTLFNNGTQNVSSFTSDTTALVFDTEIDETTSLGTDLTNEEIDIDLDGFYELYLTSGYYDNSSNEDTEIQIFKKEDGATTYTELPLSEVGKHENDDNLAMTLSLYGISELGAGDKLKVYLRRISDNGGISINVRDLKFTVKRMIGIN